MSKMIWSIFGKCLKIHNFIFCFSISFLNIIIAYFYLNCFFTPGSILYIFVIHGGLTDYLLLLWILGVFSRDEWLWEMQAKSNKKLVLLWINFRFFKLRCFIAFLVIIIFITFDISIITFWKISLKAGKEQVWKIFR